MESDKTKPQIPGAQAYVDNSVNARLMRGEIVQAGNGLYALCGRCRQIVKVNKFLFGGMHSCQ